MQEDLGHSQSQELNQDLLNADLEELIKANGDDIEFEFYYQGQLVNQNQTLFEIIKQAEAKSPPGSGGLHNYYASSAGDTSTISFCIKDKNDDLKITRKDSILEFAQKRERTKSEAVDDISVNAINSLVQQLIDKEFSVFSNTNGSEKKTNEDMK